MKGGTLFSGIGAPECAMPAIDWRWCADIDPFACAVHKARFPDIPNLGDVTRIETHAIEPVDLVVFGSPCQSFSVAGKRLGLDDPRGNMALVGLRIVGRVQPRWVVWENVPGVLSIDGGRAFGAFLWLLGQCGYGFAYRVLDAQHFGVPQRRRRVFVVGYLGDWRPAAAVLFEPESLRGDTAPRREAGKRIARPVASCPDGGSGYRNDADRADDLISHSITGRAGNASRQAGGNGNLAVGYRTSSNCGAWETGDKTGALMQGTDRTSHLVAFGGNNTAGPVDVATARNAHGGPSGRLDFESEIFITHSLRADGFDASEDGTGRGTPLIPIQNATRGQDQNGLGIGGDSMFTLDGASQHAVAFAQNQRGELRTSKIAPQLTAGGGKPGEGYPAVALQRGRPGDCASAPIPGFGQEMRGSLHEKNQSPRTSMTVRRLTPRECERLQGFPDDYTLVPYRGKSAADGPRYRAIGNSMAVPVMRWILGRLFSGDALQARLAA